MRFILLVFLLVTIFHKHLFVYASPDESTPEASLTQSDEISPIPTIETGEAIAEATAEAEINRNVVGMNNCFVLLNLYKDPEDTVDLTNIVPTSCEATQDASHEADLRIANINQAVIVQDIDESTNTGDNNIASPEGQIHTGDATSTAYISNIANTNIVGSNTLFGVVNIFAPTEKDVVLPNELLFLQAGSTSALPILVVSNKNAANIQNNITAETTTGDNAGRQIYTGDATVLIRVANAANTNILQSGFFVLHINALAPWTGSLLNYGGAVSTEGNTLTAATTFALPLNTNSPDTPVSNANDATIVNNINLQANTGENSAEDGTITTGDASIKAFISNIANTNIVGNNWFHMIVNIFDKFDGNIVLPRPDLATQTFSKATGNSEVDITIQYANGGTLWARDVQVLVHLPEGAALGSYSEGGQIDGSRIYWNLGMLEKNQGGVRTIRLALSKPGRYTIASSISTSTDEPYKQNNGSQTMVTVQKIEPQPPVVYQQTSDIVATPRPLPQKQVISRTFVPQPSKTKHILPTLQSTPLHIQDTVVKDDPFPFISKVSRNVLHALFQYFLQSTAKMLSLLR